MTDEIEDYDEELHELEDEIARGIKQLNGLTSHEDKLKPVSALFRGLSVLAQPSSHHGVRNLEKRLQRGKELLDGFTIELRELTPSEATPFKTKEGEHQSMLRSFKEQLDAIKQNAERAALGLDQQKTTPADDSKRSTAADVHQETDDILKKGAEKQKETLGALGRINKKIDDTEQVGTAINAQLAADREKLGQVKDDFADIDDGIKQSKKLLGQFVKRMQRDNCIRALLIVALVGILFVMIWSIVDPDFSLGSSGSFNAPNMLLLALLGAAFVVSRS